MKYIISEQQVNRAALSWLNMNFGNLKKIRDDENLFIYYINNDNEIIMEYNLKSKYLWVSHNDIWSFLGNFFSLNDVEVIEIIKIWVEKAYKIKGVTYLNMF